MKKANILTTACVLIVLLLAACKTDPVPPAPRTDIHLDSNVLVGKYLADKDGRTLYYFSNDANGQSNCTGGCLANWPKFFADASTFGDGLVATDFNTLVSTTGEKQTTYKGWPLYYYAPGGTAEAAGEITGEGIGNVWFVAKTNYTIMIANFQLTGADGINYLANYTPGDGRTNYFCDAKGNTLYSFAKDSAYINKFTKPDFSNDSFWPIYEADNITVPSTLDKSLFTIADFNGKKQLTYNGWPLYYYGADNLTGGMNKGITIPASQPVGSIWAVVKKDAPPAPRQ